MAGKLIYLGGGWIPGVPAADHDEPDEAKFQMKLSSKLYRSESGKEIKERQAETARAKAAVNAKAREIDKAKAADARSEATSAGRAAARLAQEAEAAEARTQPTPATRGGN